MKNIAQSDIHYQMQKWSNTIEVPLHIKSDLMLNFDEVYRIQAAVRKSYNERVLLCK